MISLHFVKMLSDPHMVRSKNWRRHTSKPEGVRVISRDELYEFSVNCFINAGVPRGEAEIVSDHLVLANLRGVESHGVVRIPFYVEGIRKGLVSPKAEIEIVKEHESVALVDGGNGLGIVVAMRATDLAIEKAKAKGVGVVVARNLGHVGMLAYYGKKISERGLIGFTCVNGPPEMAPWGGRARVLGTNPLCISLPIDGGKSIVLDMATSAVARFKLKLLAAKGERIPPGWALDERGEPTESAEEAMKGPMLPFGGYKGYGVALAVEVLSAILSGAPLSVDVAYHPSTQGGFFVEAINIDAFCGPEAYRKNIDRLLKIIKSCPLAEGFEKILLPGESEDLEYIRRMREGIPLDPTTWDSFVKLADELNVRMPKPMGLCVK